MSVPLTDYTRQVKPDGMLLTAQTAKDFINLMRNNYRRGGKKIPMQIWSERLGYKSPRSLGMLVEGKRLPSPEMIELLAKDYGLTQKEKRYFELLALTEKETKPRLRDKIKEELAALRALKDQRDRLYTVEEAASLYNWYIFVVRQLVGTRGFKEDLPWIRRRLRQKLSLTEIQEAIRHLLIVGGLTRDSEGQLQKTKVSFMTRDDLPSEYTRKHHSQLLDRAKEAIHEQGVHEREMNTLVFSCRKAQLPALKQQLRDFRKTINEQFCVDEGDSVFQLNLQLFEHTLDLEDTVNDK